MDQFSTLSVVVTEEIKPKKLTTFIQTQITLHNILTSKESYLFCSFIPEVLRYEIILFREKKSIYECGIFSLTKLCKEDEYTLFILEELFCVYKKDKPLFIKKVSNTPQEDITSYIEQTYNIIPSNIKYIDNKELQALIEKDDISKKEIERNVKKLKSSNSFRYFIYYTLTLFLILSFLLYDKIANRNTIEIANTFNKNQYTQEFITYKKHSKGNSIQTLINFINYLQTRNINLTAIKYINNKFELQLTNTSKEVLLKVLEYKNKKTELQFIQLKDETELYLMEVILHG